MPRGDGTGPLGLGPMTGRGLGFCNPDYVNAPPAYGWGMGFGRGRGFWGGGRGRGGLFFASGFGGWLRPIGYSAPYQTPDPELEKQMLKNEADALQSELNLIKKRLEDLESRKSAE
jgi:hypothetical protein